MSLVIALMIGFVILVRYIFDDVSRSVNLIKTGKEMEHDAVDNRLVTQALYNNCATPEGQPIPDAYKEDGILMLASDVHKLFKRWGKKNPYNYCVRSETIKWNFKTKRWEAIATDLRFNYQLYLANEEVVLLEDIIPPDYESADSTEAWMKRKVEEWLPRQNEQITVNYNTIHFEWPKHRWEVYAIKNGADIILYMDNSDVKEDVQDEQRSQSTHS